MSATVDAAAAAAVSRSDHPTRPISRDGRGNHQISQLPYLPGLDGIRALAVVAVMVYHANSNWLHGGYLGVEVFFVISGYLITLLLIAEHERTGRIDLTNFWMRRARRLLPALFVMLLLLSMWVSLFERSALGKLRGDVIAGVLYGSNWYQIWIGAGYSAGNDFAPLRHLWSLAVEEQFYVIWPVVMFAFLRSGSRRIAGIARWLFLAAVAVTVVVAVLSHSGPQQTPALTPDAYWTIAGRAISKPDALYLSTITRAGGLLLGSAFAMVWRPVAIMRGPLRRRGALFDLGAILGLVALGAMAWKVGFQPSEGVDGFLFRGGLFATGIATLAVIAAVTHQGALAGRVLSIPILLWIGKRSYGLYLYHWPIYQIIRHIAANRLRLHEFILAMVATCIVTELSYRFVETPIREGRLSELWKRRRAGARRAPMSSGERKGALVGAAVATALGVFAVSSMATAELRQNDVQESLDAGRASTCDTLIDLDCDGTPDVDADGNPLATPTEVGDPAGPDFVPSEGTATAGQATPGTGSIDPGVAAPPDSAAVVPGTTVPPTVETFPAIERLAVGDSVMQGAAGELEKLGFTVDAIESRAFVNGLDYVQKFAERGPLPETMVIHLGTNSQISQDEMDKMMVAVADVDRVVFVTNVIPNFPDVATANNALIVKTADQYPNVTYLAWAEGLSAACVGDCFYSDGIHLKPAGQAYYAQLIADLLGL